MPKSDLRLQLVLGKFRVVSIVRGRMTLQLGGTTEMSINLPPQADVRLGDLLTLYTEIPVAQPS